MKTKKIFCANEQEETEHTVSINDNNEYVFTCKCGRFVKFSSDMKAADLSKAIKTHKEANEGQVSREAIEKEMEKKLEALIVD